MTETAEVLEICDGPKPQIHAESQNAKPRQEYAASENKEYAGSFHGKPPRYQVNAQTKANASQAREDWRQGEDPIWGTLYYVNKWNGEMEYDLHNRKVPQLEIKITFIVRVGYNENLGNVIEKWLTTFMEKELEDINRCALETVVSPGDIGNTNIVMILYEDSILPSTTSAIREHCDNEEFQDRLKRRLTALPLMRRELDANNVGGKPPLMVDIVGVDVEEEDHPRKAKIEGSPKSRSTQARALDYKMALSERVKFVVEGIRINASMHPAVNLGGEVLGIAGSNLFSSIPPEQLSNLKELHLQKCNLGRGAQKLIDAFPPDSSLRILMLDDNNLDVMNWTSMIKTPIEELYVSGNPDVGNEIEVFKNMISLRTLDLSDCDVKHGGEVLCCYLSKLEKLILRNNSNLKQLSEIVKEWEKGPKRRMLDCRGSRIDEKEYPPNLPNGILIR